MIVENFFENLDVLHLNTQPNRAYYIPASTRRDDLVLNRENSDRFQPLSGQWAFRYYPSVRELTEEFYAQGYDASDFDTVAVPSTWQSTGYEIHHYTNVRFPFPFDPPYVPWENPCGAYLRKFSYTPDPNAPRAYLNFEGVDSCFYVWLNGQFVGYSQVSHATAEFDVTERLHDGENTLAVLVLKWCDGSYMEDQDKFRASGIFRDVYLLKRPENCLWDYFITAGLDGKVQVRMDFRGETVPVKLTLLDGEAVVATTETTEKEVCLQIAQPKLWNPEQPFLYTLLLEMPGEVITERVGLREITVDGVVVKLNGVPIKFRGVNRHDSHPITGPVVSLDHIRRDLELFRQFNFNSIRTSHYPNVPQFYQMCDQYGFMVIDEADHESHGAQRLIYNDVKDWADQLSRWATPMADNPIFTEATVDRVRLCVQRDKNRPSVVIWSMGNECAYGCCFEAALRWTKEFDPTRLTHYESAYHPPRDKKSDFSNLDTYSRMYPDVEVMERQFAAGMDKPYILCEYVHAMGNGPGDIEDYWEVFQKHPGSCGGFVWEWTDHAVYKGQAENGKPMYWYGGDHGEFPHDDNFCMDGLVYPDRRPHTGLMEYKNVNRPLRATWEKGLLTVHNYLDFTCADRLEGRWALTCDGGEVAAGVLKLPAIAPHGEGVVELPLEIPETGSCWLKVEWFTLDDHPLLPAGSSVGFDEIELRNADSRYQPALALWKEMPGKLAVEEGVRYIQVKGEGFAYSFDKATGLPAALEFGGKALLEKPVELNIWRAPTDNDRKLKIKWREQGFDRAITRAYETKVEESADGVMIRSTLSLAPIFLQRIMTVEAVWQIDGAGAITAKLLAHKDERFTQLPRFGLRLFLPRDMEQVRYFGMGPVESYRDKRRASWHGLFESDVLALHEDYLRPQENGSHYDCSYVNLRSREQSLQVTADIPFSFNASPYTQEELTKKKHSYELEPCGSTVLCLDYAQNGIGSASCGTTLMKKYALTDTEMAISFRLVPGK